MNRAMAAGVRQRSPTEVCFSGDICGDRDTSPSERDAQKRRFKHTTSYVLRRKNLDKRLGYRLTSSVAAVRFSRHSPVDTLQSLKKRLDDMNLEELERLQNIIRTKQGEKSHGDARRSSKGNRDRRSPFHRDRTSCHLDSRIELPTSAFGVHSYTTVSLGLCKYPADLRDPRQRIQNRYTNRYDRIVVSHDELMNTNYLLLYRKHFDALDSDAVDDLIHDRVFAINNAPSLGVLTALIDENLTYIKFHRVHGLPVNPNDVYMSTAGLLKHALFNKMNMAKLSCVLDYSRKWEKEYQILRQLANKPIVGHKLHNTAFEIQRKPPTYFKHPLQRAMSIVVSFSRIVGAIRRKFERADCREPHFVRDFDENGVTDFYRCGMVSEMIFDALRDHKCEDATCQNKIKRLLQPYRSSLFFCPFNNTRFHSDSSQRRDVRKKRRAPDVEPDVPKVAYTAEPVTKRLLRETRRLYRRRDKIQNEHRVRSDSVHRTAYVTDESSETNGVCPLYQQTSVRSGITVTSTTTITPEKIAATQNGVKSKTVITKHVNEVQPKREKRGTSSEAISFALPPAAETAGSETEQESTATEGQDVMAVEITAEDTLDPDNEEVWMASVTPVDATAEHVESEDDSDSDANTIPDGYAADEATQSVHETAGDATMSEDEMDFSCDDDQMDSE